MDPNEQSHNQEREQLLEIFPVEIWDHIFYQFDDPNELNNLTFASPYFKTLLKSQAAVYLFPQVLKLLDANKYINFTHSLGLLKCRLVSRRWKFSIDRILEIRPHHSQLKQSNYNATSEPQHFTHPTDISCNTYFPLYKFNIEKIETEILSEMNSPFYQTNSPFPSRHLKMSELILSRRRRQGEPVDFQRYRAATEKFLNKTGHHIWHVQIDLLEWPLLEWYKRLEKYVKLMPNLKSLYLPPAPSCTRYDFANDAKNMSHNPIPFPKLEHLQLLSVIRVPGPAINAILLSNDISIVDIYRACADDFDISLIQNPKKLAIILLDEDINRISTNCKPEVLRLSFRLVSEDSFKLSDIFEKLECFHESLTELSLDFRKATKEENIKRFVDDSEKPLKLPNLKLLDINLSNYASVEYLIGLTSLEYLFVRIIGIFEWAYRGSNLTCSDPFNNICREYNLFSQIESLKEIRIDSNIYEDKTWHIIRENLRADKNKFIQNYVDGNDYMMRPNRVSRSTIRNHF